MAPLALGRQSVVTYPNVQSARFAAEYHYTSLGFLQYVADASDHTPYWVAKSMDATGQVTDEYTRNGVETVSTHNLSMGWLMDATTTAVADSNTLIQHWTNTYDEVGNLISRARSQPTNMADSIESFGYDHLDRLTSAEVKIPSESYDVTESYAFDSIGNLTQKGGKTYTYTGCAAGGGPHAVCTVDGSPGYSYDQNGNMVAGNGRTVTYNSFNKVSYIAGNQPTSDGSSPTVRFMYGADGNRVVQSVGTTTAGSEAARTVYVGMGGTGKSMYERTTHPTSGVTEHVHFLYAGGAHGGNAFALRVVTTGTQAGSNSSSDPQDAPTVAMRYQHFDHLGSVTASTDENGRVVGALGGAETTVFGYDAWGARRSPDGRPATGALDLQVGHREFTGHETIPSVGLVNMNGRVYDPELGRFLTPDPTVQFVADLQSYNRYSYVLNNPLRYTDPTGTFLGGAFDIFVNAVIMVAAVVVCAYSVGSGCVAAFALLATIYNTSSMVYSGVPFDQAIGIGLFGMAAGVVGGGAGAAFAQGIGLASQSMATAVVGGAIAGAYSSAMATIAFANGRGLGQNMLLGTASGALGAALAWSAQATNPVSEAAEANASGEGGGSGADKVETANQAAATRGITEDEEVREFGPSARASIARENYEFAIENMKASGELGGPVIGASGDPIYTAWTFQVSANMDYNIGPISVHLSVGLAADSSGGLAATYSAGGGAGAGAGASVSVGYDVSSGASVNDLGGPFATTETSVGLGPSASASGYTGKGSQGQQVGGNGWGVGVGVGGGTYTGGSVTKVWQIW